MFSVMIQQAVQQSLYSKQAVPLREWPATWKAQRPHAYNVNADVARNVKRAALRLRLLLSRPLQRHYLLPL